MESNNTELIENLEVEEFDKSPFNASQKTNT